MQMAVRHSQIARAFALCLSAASVVVLFMYGMAPDKYEVVLLAAGASMMAGLTTFCATFVFGPLAYSRGSTELWLSRALLLFLVAGLVVVGSAAVRSVVAWAAGAA